MTLYHHLCGNVVFFSYLLTFDLLVHVHVNRCQCHCYSILSQLLPTFQIKCIKIISALFSYFPCVYQVCAKNPNLITIMPSVMGYLSNLAMHFHKFGGFTRDNFKKIMKINKISRPLAPDFL